MDYLIPDWTAKLMLIIMKKKRRVIWWIFVQGDHKEKIKR